MINRPRVRRRRSLRVPDAQYPLLIYTEAMSEGGTTAIAATLARRMRPGGEVVVVYSGHPALRQWAGELRNDGITVHALALRNYSDFVGWLDIPRILRLQRLVRSYALVHCHAHSPFACVPFILLAMRSQHTPLLVTEHGLGAMQFLRRRTRGMILHAVREQRIRLLMKLKARAMRRADGIATVCDDHKRILAQWYGNDLLAKVRTVHSGIDPRPFLRRGGSRPSFLRSVDLYDVEKVVTTIAALNNAKGHTYLLHAFVDIRRQFPRTRLLLVGDGHIRTFLEREVEHLGLSGYVVFAGHRSDVAQILAATDLAVLPSLFEGSPLFLLEAMAAARAVVATRVGGVPELVVAGRTGLLVPPGDSQELAAAISTLLEQRQRRALMGRQGRIRLRKFFTDDAMCRRYSEFYASLLHNTGNPPMPIAKDWHG